MPTTSLLRRPSWSSLDREAVVRALRRVPSHARELGLPPATKRSLPKLRPRQVARGSWLIRAEACLRTIAIADRRRCSLPTSTEQSFHPQSDPRTSPILLFQESRWATNP